MCKEDRYIEGPIIPKTLKIEKIPSKLFSFTSSGKIKVCFKITMEVVEEMIEYVPEMINMLDPEKLKFRLFSSENRETKLPKIKRKILLE